MKECVQRAYFNLELLLSLLVFSCAIRLKISTAFFKPQEFITNVMHFKANFISVCLELV